MPMINLSDKEMEWIHQESRNKFPDLHHKTDKLIRKILKTYMGNLI